MIDSDTFRSLAETYQAMLLGEAIEQDPQHLKHIHHAEDRPLFHGGAGFEHAHAALMHAHEHMKAGKHSTDLTMKYDGSPAVVFGHHPKTKKFFVATKSAWNKNPKINYSDADIDKNHGHAPGLASKLKSALKHLPKVTPKKGIYHGDLMHTKEDHRLHEETLLEEGDKVSFTPNTITYTARGDEARKVKRSHIGIVVHQQYKEHPKHQGSLEHMSVSPHPDMKGFKSHPDVHMKTAEHDTSKISYTKADQDTFHKHMAAAKAIHDKHGPEMYAATHKHQGEGGHLGTYINSTIRNDEKPSVAGFKKHLAGHHERLASKMKTPSGQAMHRNAGAEHIAHVTKHAEHYKNLLQMHHHLAQAKNTLVKSLETHEGGLEHHIGGTKSKPEGFVINHTYKGRTEPTKLVNRHEFAKANLLKTFKKPE